MPTCRRAGRKWGRGRRYRLEAGSPSQRAVWFKIEIKKVLGVLYKKEGPTEISTINECERKAAIRLILYPVLRDKCQREGVSTFDAVEPSSGSLPRCVLSVTCFGRIRRVVSWARVSGLSCRAPLWVKIQFFIFFSKAFNHIETTTFERGGFWYSRALQGKGNVDNAFSEWHGRFGTKDRSRRDGKGLSRFRVSQCGEVPQRLF